MLSSPTHVDRLAAIVLVHALVALLLVPLQYLVFALLEMRALPEAIEVFAGILYVLAVGGTHGIALGQLWLIATWGALDGMHWVIRLAVATVSIASLLVLWSVVHGLRCLLAGESRWFERDYSPMNGFGIADAVLLSLGYALLIVAVGWATRTVGRVRFTLIEGDAKRRPSQWQISIRDVLLATLIVGIVLAVGRWQGGYWVRRAGLLFQYTLVPVVIVAVHALVSAPLLQLTAYRTLTLTPASARTPRSLRLVLLTCGIETVILLVIVGLIERSAFRDWPILAGATAGLFLALTSAQLLVIIATVRAVRLAGGELVRDGG